METFAVVGSGPAAYEEYLVPVLFRPLAEATLGVAGLLAGRRVLDVACGTGVVARLATRAGARATGLDVNPEMVAVGRKLEPAVDWLAGPAESLPFPDESFDVVFCQQGLQFVTDRAEALRQLRRVLVPGGRIAVTLWRELARTPGFAAFVDVLDRHADASLGDMLRAPFSQPSATALRDLVAAAGFTKAHLRIHLFAVRFASVQAFFDEEVAASPLATPVAALPPRTRRAMVEDLTATLAGYLDDDGLVFPIETHLLTAQT